MRWMLFITGLIFLLQGCVKETSWAVKDDTPRKLIVDAIITNEVKTHRVNLSYPVSQLNQVPEPVTGAGVMISNEDSTWQLTENPPMSGIYNTPPYFISRLQKNYTLLISAEGKVYTAKATMTVGSVFGELQYARNEDNNLYYVCLLYTSPSPRD